LPYEKKFYAIFALFLAALIFIASKTICFKHCLP